MSEIKELTLRERLERVRDYSSLTGPLDGSGRSAFEQKWGANREGGFHEAWYDRGPTCEAALAEIDALTARLAATERERDDWKRMVEGVEAQALREDFEDAVERIADLEAALRKYGQHDVLCSMQVPGDACDCGLAALLAAAPADKEGSV